MGLYGWCTKRRQFDASGSWKRTRGQFTGPGVLTDRSGPRNHEFSMITSLFGPLGAPGPLGLFAPDLNRLYQRHWGLEGSRKAKKWRRHTPDCSSQLTSHSLSPLWVSREAKAAIQAPSPLWYKKIAQIQASTGPEINFLTKPRPIPAFPPMGLGGSTKKRGFCDNFFRVKIVWTPLITLRPWLFNSRFGVRQGSQIDQSINIFL